MGRSREIWGDLGLGGGGAAAARGGARAGRPWLRRGLGAMALVRWPWWARAEGSGGLRGLGGRGAPLRPPALPCAPLRSPALPCAPLRSPALPCAPLRSPALLCAPLRSSALLCAALERPGPEGRPAHGHPGEAGRVRGWAGARLGGREAGRVGCGAAWAAAPPGRRLEHAWVLGEHGDDVVEHGVELGEVGAS